MLRGYATAGPTNSYGRRRRRRWPASPTPNGGSRPGALTDGWFPVDAPRIVFGLDPPAAAREFAFPLPGVAAGASPAYDVTERGGDVVELEILLDDG